MAWSHDSMTADSSVILGAIHVQAGADVAVRLLRHRLSFLVGRGKRNAGFALRRQLTLDFLDKAEDACIQDHFSDLYWLLHDRRGSTHSVPRWDAVLADRSLQPGERMPRVRLGAG